MQKVSSFVKKIVALRGSSHQISIGFAIGVFVGIFPTFGLGGFVIVALAGLWKFNIPAAVLATLIGNPLFAPLWIFLSCAVTGLSPSHMKIPSDNFRHIIAHFSQLGLRYFLGNFLISTIVAVISYYVTTGLLSWNRNRRLQKIAH